MDRLAELRERRALTLRELSEMGGVAADTINQIELGHRKARPSTLRKLAKALDVDVRELFEEPALSGKVEAPREAESALEVSDERFSELLTRPNEYPPVLDISNEDFKELVEGLSYDQTGELLEELREYAWRLQESQPTLRSREEIREWTRRNPALERRGARAGGRAVAVIKYRRALRAEHEQRDRATEEQAAELATA